MARSPLDPLAHRRSALAVCRRRLVPRRRDWQHLTQRGRLGRDELELGSGRIRLGHLYSPRRLVNAANVRPPARRPSVARLSISPSTSQSDGPACPVFGPPTSLTGLVVQPAERLQRWAVADSAPRLRAGITEARKSSTRRTAISLQQNGLTTLCLRGLDRSPGSSRGHPVLAPHRADILAWIDQPGRARLAELVVSGRGLP
jgi:hypothetical protein